MQTLLATGEMLYVTCSLLKSENEHVVAAFAAQTPDAVRVPLRAPAAASCRVTPEGATFFPSALHQGGFVAKLRKQAGGGASGGGGGRRGRH